MMEQRRFNLVKSFSIGSLVAIIIAAILLGWMYRILAVAELTNQGERYNVILARTMSNAVWPQVKGVMDMVSENKKFSDEEKKFSILMLGNSIEELLDKTNVLKIIIFDRNGRVLYSTDHQLIGKINKNSSSTSNDAWQGKVLSKLEFKESFQSINGIVNHRHILESYLPITNIHSSSVDGVFEIYTDTTEAYHQMEKSQLTFMSVLGGILSIVYLTLFFVVRHADKVIKKQAFEREGHLHEIESINAELDDYARELAMARDLALDASKAKSAFLANMSHELRTPLNAIIGYSEMMAEEMGMEGREADASDLKKINTAGTHLLSVINDILDLSKIEAGRMELCLEELELPDTIHTIIETAKPLADKEQNTIKVNIADDIEKMYTDLTRLRQVLLNLLSNACKFTKNGIITLDINRQRDDNSMLVFTVKDTGVGMEEEQIRNIFKAFKQADSSTTRQFGGTGLGLTISKRFCEMLGGSINVVSEPGTGSTFKVKLPERSSTTTGREVKAVIQKISAEEVRLTKNDIPVKERRSKVSKIMVVDDDLGVSDLVMRTLVADGFEIKVVNDSGSAFEEITQWVPDAILLDVMMPEVDGWAILKTIKEDKTLKTIPVIMMTVVENYAMAESLGADGFVVKPINRKKLKNAITLCLRSTPLINTSKNVTAVR